MKNKLICAVLVSTVVFLASCSSSSDDPDNSGSATNGGTDGTTDGSTGGSTDGPTGNDVSTGGDVNLWGTVSIEQDATSLVEISGTFIRSNQNLPSAALINAYRPELDTCELSNITIDVSDPIANIPDIDAEFVPEFVSAGEVITFTAAGSSFTELQREVTPAQTVQGISIPAFTVYGLPEGINLTGPVPADLTFSIPGDVFPTFDSVSVPAVETLQIQSPGAEPITASTTFTWTASSNADTVINISASAIDTQTFEFSTLSCTAMDDGSFTIPAAVQTQMGAGFSALVGAISRTAFNAQQQGNALLLVSNSSVASTGF